ncbi:MAG TPA: DNA-3-methyladenine glycosylase I [Thermoflexales bacterium]|nr:DNA-3-methyladenine glycosylase I [Thermoflexales bacterium]HQW34203.1 DNA-3-methyladenine glycosylase I [Thermoflexales bacterium]HQZ20855.1 DNA-3-methyladenine glycosylase I [Thermoflexales bacterium]HRA00463.1 DNA-3-methyladenine glycosylase I [Thermoflexales bacterium]
MQTYCAFVATMPPDNVHRQYHHYEYGFPLSDDNTLFERLVLEINQAGLSWATILNKRANFQRAYLGFDVAVVAEFDEPDRARLLADAGIIRNRLKVNAAIENARRIQAIQREHGSFKAWLDANVMEDAAPRTRESWTKLFKKTFVFTGGEIVNEFLMSTGYLPGAHSSDCPTYAEIEKLKPAWMQAITND